MKNKKNQKLSVVALIISVLPLTTFIPILLNISLANGVNTVWAGANIISVLVGLILSVTCAKNSDNRSIVNIISMIISAFWVLLICGIAVLTLFLNFAQP